jgi:glycosyltransferase involved in cell wall biosynthesis
MTRPIRLLIVSKSTGGVATYVRSLVNGLDGNKFAITVACLSENGKEFSEELIKRYGIRAFSLAMNRYKINPLTDAWVFVQLAYHIRREKYDVIHAHASKPGFVTRLAAIGTGIPVVYSPHNFAFHEGSKKTSAWSAAILEKFAALFTAKIVAVAQHERDLALHYGVGTRDIYTVIHTGIDPSPFQGKFDVSSTKKHLDIPTQSRVVGAVGRLAVPKLPMDFVRVAEKLRQMQPDVHFVWVGAGPLEAEARKLTSDLGLDNVIHWLGQRADVPALYRIFDCFVLFSQWEAYPYVVLEAFVSGVPVVAYRNLGTEEIIEAGVNGLLVPQGDIPAAVDSIKNLLGNSALAERLRVAAEKQVGEMYTMEKMIFSLEDLYVQKAREMAVDEFAPGFSSD